MEELRKLVEGYNIGIPTVVILTILCLLSAVFAAREFLAWYLKVKRVENLLSEILSEVHALKIQVDTILSNPYQSAQPPTNPISPPSPGQLTQGPHQEVKDSNPEMTQFPLSH